MIVSDHNGEIHKRNVLLIKEQMPYMEDEVLLLEANPFLQPWIDYAKLMKERVKLFNRSMILFTRVWLGPAQSGEDYEKMFTDYQSEAESIKKNIAGLENTMKKYHSEELSLLMWTHPGYVIGAAITKEMVQFPLDVLSGDNQSFTKKFGQEMGLHKLPVVGRMFTDPPAGCMFIGSDYEQGPAGAVDDYFRCMMLEKESTRRESNGFITLFNNIQRLFLLDFIPEGRVMDINSRAHTRRILIEADDSSGDFSFDPPDAKSIDPKIVSDSLIKIMEEAGVFTEMEEAGEQLLVAKKTFIDKVLDPILAKVETGSELSAAATFEDFAAAIESKKSIFPDLAKMDIKGYEQALDKSLEEIRQDPKKWGEMMDLAKKQIGDIEEGKDEEDPGAGDAPEDDLAKSENESQPEMNPEVEKKLMEFAKRMIFQETKTEIQDSLVEATEDSYEDARQMITEGLGTEGLALLGETDVGKKHLELIQESMEKLEQAFTKLKSMK